MPRAPLARRLQAAFWELSPPLRRAARRLLRAASLARHRAAWSVGQRRDARVVAVAAAADRPVRNPAIAVRGADSEPRLGGQTERSLVAATDGAARVDFIADGELGSLPAVHLEALLMAAAAVGSGWTVGGWTPPAPGRFGPSGRLFRDPAASIAAHALVRLPGSAAPPSGSAPGRAVPHVTSAERCAGLELLEQPTSVAVGPHRLRPVPTAAVVRQPWFAVDEALAALPAEDGPRTALFLLPYLAVGGAERLLFELLEGFGGGVRSLVVTTDPHLESLGQTVDRARELTPHVYTLGDWLPRDAVASAVRHLIRRWRVDTLVCWNGSVTFYDEAASLRDRFPHLRLVNQLYNHRGGWIEHFSSSFVSAVDAQVAVNTPIARALVDERGVPAERVATIHHAVAPAAPRDAGRRAALRRELGVGDDTVVIGTFVRMHRQKRPLDIVRLARAMARDPVHFLLVGGGPLDAEIDREIARDRPANLTRRPMVDDAAPLYDAVDLCLMTSEFEGLPVFLLDGLARGLPCVATAVGDIPMLLADGGGRTVARPGDIDGLAAAVRSLLDPETRRAQGERGRRTVEQRFGLERYVSAYERVIFPTGR